MKKSTSKIVSRLLSPDHRDIGWDYLVFAICAGFLGSVLSFLIRAGLHVSTVDALKPVAQILFNQQSDASVKLLLLLSKSHALIMTFLMVMPALIGGFANWLVPLMIGAGNVAFPKVNRLAFWLLIPALIMLILGFVGASNNLHPHLLLLVAIYLASFSLLLTFGNLFTTIIALRILPMRLLDMPVFVWSVLISSFLGVVYVPIMLAAITFDFGASQKPHEDMQIALWFFSHPEIYVLLLPAFGIISQIVSTFSKRVLVGQKIVIGSMILLGLFGFMLWVENLFAPAMEFSVARYFSYALPLIGLPSIVIIVCWLLTIYQARPAMSVPMHWVMGFIVMSLIGGLSALQLNNSRLSVPQDASAIISHFHYILSLSAVFAIFAGWYFWFPKMSGYVYNLSAAKLHFWSLFTGVNMIFLPQFFVEIFPPVIPLLGAILSGFSLLIFLSVLAWSYISKRSAGMNPWGEGAVTLEWRSPSTQVASSAGQPEVSR